MTQTKQRFSPTLPGGTLYPFQVEALEYIWQHRGRAICGHRRGRGKTPIAIAWLHYNNGLRPAVMVVPAAIKRQWARALAHWMGIPEEEVTVLNGRKAQVPADAQLIVVNYDILKDHLRALQAIQPRVVIYDEIQRTKSSTAARSVASRNLAQHPSVMSTIGLSGTMFMNRPKEGWHQVLVVNPTIWPNWWKYANRYCNPRVVNTTAQRGPDGKVLKGEDGKPLWNTAKDFSGASHTDELARTLKDKVLCRPEDAQVDSQTPPIQRATVPFECDLKEYLKLRDSARRKLKEIRAAIQKRRVHWGRLSEPELSKALAAQASEDSMVKLYGMAGAEIALLRHATALLKIPHVVEWAEDFIESEDPLLLFGHHHDAMDNLVEQLNLRVAKLAMNKLYCRLIPPPLDGRMGQRARDNHVAAFRTGEYPALAAGIGAMGEGYDGLQHAASHLAFLELGWNRAAHDQAEGRLDRNGQTKPVNAYYLVAVDTIDEQMVRLLDAKNTVTSASYGELPPPGVIESIMDYIIEES